MKRTGPGFAEEKLIRQIDRKRNRVGPGNYNPPETKTFVVRRNEDGEMVPVENLGRDK